MRSVLPGGPGEAFIFLVRYVVIRDLVSVSFCQAKVDNVNHVAAFLQSHQKVVRFDVAMNEIFAKNSCSYLSFTFVREAKKINSQM